MNLKIILEPCEEGGYTAIVPSLPGCISEGDSREEALLNIKEAINLYLESVEDDLSYSPNAELLDIAVWRRFQTFRMKESLRYCSEQDGL
jgi:predicted RNase H-like HicB family nuclease